MMSFVAKSIILACKIIYAKSPNTIDGLSITEYYPNSILYKQNQRGIAQSGSAPALGAGCRGFESLYPEQIAGRLFACHCVLNAPVAQLDRASAF